MVLGLISTLGLSRARAAGRKLRWPGQGSAGTFLMLPGLSPPPIHQLSYLFLTKSLMGVRHFLGIRKDGRQVAAAATTPGELAVGGPGGILRGALLRGPSWVPACACLILSTCRKQMLSWSPFC